MAEIRTTQLRRYRIVPGELEAFVAWWRDLLVPARDAYGYRVEGAWSVPSTDEFVWVVSVAGDAAALEHLDAAWAASPERAVVFAGVPKRVAESVVTVADPIA